MKIALHYLFALVLAFLAAVALVRLSSRSADRTSTAALSGTRSHLAVVCGHIATYSLAQAVLEGTGAKIAWGWAEGTTWEDQPHSLLSSEAADAHLVLTMRSAVPSDPLLGAVRKTNASALEIDVTANPSLTATAIKLSARPNNSPAPDFALSIGNAMRMSEIMTRELSRHFPAEAKRIEENGRKAKERLFRIQNSIDTRLGQLENVDVRLRSPVFRAMAEELGLMVVSETDAPESIVLTAGRSSEASADEVVLDSLSGPPSQAAHYFAALEQNAEIVIQALRSKQ